MRQYYLRFFSDKPCPTCHGARLRPEAAGGAGARQDARRAVAADHRRGPGVSLRAHAVQPGGAGGRELLKEIRSRLGFLLDVGFGYLTLERGATTLSGGESQRIRLASQMGTELTGVIYILDEPSIGLHQRDNGKLLGTLKRLRDLGNSVIVVEHDEETMEEADWLVDFGPGAGELGGEVVAYGTPAGRHAQPGEPHRRLPERAGAHCGAPDTAVHPASRSWWWRGRGPTTSRTSPSSFRWDVWWPSPASPAPASPRW